MALIKDVGRLFKRRSRPVEIDLTASPADDNGEDRDTSTTDQITMIEPKPMRDRRETARGYDEVVGLVRRIGDHLDQQTERTERVIQVLDRIPEMIEAMPEIGRQNATLLEGLHEHFEHARRREDTLNATLTTVTETSGRQLEVLSLIQQQLDSSNRADTNFNETLENLRGALSDLADSNSRSSDVLLRMSEETSSREMEFRKALTRTQGWIFAAMVCCGAVSVVAMIVAGIAMFG